MRLPLDGSWAFSYSPSPPACEGGVPLPPPGERFRLRMPVPGIWDDNGDAFAGLPAGDVLRNPLHAPVQEKYDAMRGVGPGSALTDGSLPNIVGTGWYETGFRVPEGLSPCVATLDVGGVFLEAWVFLNGRFLGHHLGHSTPFRLALDGALREDGENRLLIGVSNLRTDRLGTSIRGFAAGSGGIYRSVAVEVRREAGIEDLYVRTDAAMRKLLFEARVRGSLEGCRLEWEVRGPHGGPAVLSGSLPVEAPVVRWDADADGIRRWSEYDPALYGVRLRLVRGDDLLDAWSQRYGLRRIGTDGRKVLLNGNPVFLRGATDHCYWPLTTTVPTDPVFCRGVLARIAELGFNWIRCHTWVPPHEYLDAADELGLMVQVEPPAGFGEGEWRDICLSCRRHPSVVLYCGGNEEVLDEAMIGHLERMAALQRDLVPDALFNPHEALRGVEYGRTVDPRAGLGEPVVEEPFPHNPVRLRRIESFSDVIGAYAHGRLSYKGVSGRTVDLDRELALYARPCLSHEIGIQGTYLDVSLESRYRGLRTGPEMFEITRKALEEKGLLRKAGEYYAQSCRFQRIVRKHVFETARRSALLAGYDFLGPNDSHWARCGYPCGMLNEFFEYKPGETAEATRRYNDDCVLLLDVGNDRNHACGSAFEAEVLVSNYWHSPLRVSSLRWTLLGRRGTVHAAGRLPCRTVAMGCVRAAGRVRFLLPALEKAERFTLRVVLSGDRLLENEWDLYGYPEPEPPSAGPFVAEELTEAVLERAERGDAVVLLGPGGLPSVGTEFKNCLAGRESGIQATIVSPHPAVADLPAEGFCGFPFFRMLEGGHAYDFEEMDGLPFDPIIEVVSSFKNPRRLAALFELRIGRGRLLACSLNLDPADPGAWYFRAGLLAYAAGDSFQPAHTAPAERLCGFLRGPRDTERTTGTDMALDPNAVRLRERRNARPGSRT